MTMEAARNAANAGHGRSRSENISKPAIFSRRGATASSAAAAMSSASSTHKNHAGPDGHGPIVSVRHQK
jgi:hypothetical protein